MDIKDQLDKLTSELKTVGAGQKEINALSTVYLGKLGEINAVQEKNKLINISEREGTKDIIKLLKIKYKETKKLAKLSKKGFANLKSEGKLIEVYEKNYDKIVDKKSNEASLIKEMIDSKKKQHTLDTFINKSMLDSQGTLGKLLAGTGKWGKAMGVVSAVVGGFVAPFKIVFKVVGSIVKLAWKLAKPLVNIVKNVISKVIDRFLQLESITGNISTDLGLTTTQMKMLRREAAMSTDDFIFLGATLEDIATAQGKFTDETGRNVLLSANQLKNIIEIGKGTALGVEQASELVGIMDLFGESVGNTRDFIQDSNMEMQAMGLNSKKVFNTFVGLVKQSTLYTGSLSKGVNGLMDISKLSAKYKIQLEGMTGMADDLFNPEGAIEMAAKLKILGGEFANMADPFKLMYQAQNDIEGLTKNLIDATAGSAKFNSVTKEFEIPPKQRAILNEVAAATGQSAENLAQAALQSAKFTKATAAMDRSGLNFTDNMREYVENIATFKDGKAMVQVSNGVKMVGVEISKLNSTQFDQIIQQQKEAQNLEAGARNRMNILEKLQAIGQQFFARVGGSLLRILESDKFNNMIKMVGDVASQLIDKIGVFIDTAMSPGGAIMTFIDGASDTFSGIIDKVSSILNGDGLEGFGNYIKDVFTTTVIPFLGDQLGNLFLYVWEKAKGFIMGAGIGSIAGALIGSLAGPMGTIIGAQIGGVAGAAIGTGAQYALNDGRIDDPQSASIQTGKGSVNVQKFAKGDALYAINEKTLANKGGGSGGNTINNFNMPATVTIKVEGGGSHTVTRKEIIAAIAANYQDVANKSTKIADTEKSTGQQGKRSSDIPVLPMT